MRNPTEFFKPYDESYFARVLTFLRYLVAVFVVLWVQLSVKSGSSDFDIVSFTFNLGMVFLLLEGINLAIFVTKPNKEDKTVFSSIGFGTTWRAMWGGVMALGGIIILNAGTQLSFFAPVLDFGDSTMFWFLVFLGPVIEEGFSMILHPMITMFFYNHGPIFSRGSYTVSGAISLFLIVAPMFAVFHWVTYFAKSGANTQLLIIMIAAAYIYRVIFTLGNYLLQTSEFGLNMHMLHNFLGYYLAFGLPAFSIFEQVVLLIMFAGLGLWYTMTLIIRVGRLGYVRGLAPE